MQGIILEIWGDYACFTVPPHNSERMSCDIITPTAAQGILDNIYWHPGLQWKINRIHVINRIKKTSIKTKELTKKPSPTITIEEMEVINENGEKEKKLYDIFRTSPVDASKNSTLRNSLILKDVHYVIEAQLEGAVQDKDIAIARRRMKKGQSYYETYLGQREYPLGFKYLKSRDEIPESYYKGRRKNIGRIPHTIDHENDICYFFDATIQDGAVEVPYLIDRGEAV